MQSKKRFLLAALVGGLTMFVWGAFSHMFLIKGIGFSPLPNEDHVVDELKSSITEDGLYFFPGANLRGDPSTEENAAWEAKFSAGPTGMLVYHPSSGAPVSPKKLLVQFATELLAAGIAAYLLSLVVGPYRRRVLVIALLGAFGCLSISALYWNWYGFPTAFFLAQCVDKVGGWLLAGAVLARLVPPPIGDAGVTSVSALSSRT